MTAFTKLGTPTISATASPTAPIRPARRKKIESAVLRKIHDQYRVNSSKHCKSDMTESILAELTPIVDQVLAELDVLGVVRSRRYYAKGAGNTTFCTPDGPT